MSKSGCTHHCESCKEDCSQNKGDLLCKLNNGSAVKKVIGIVSGKGGVGKSLVTSLLAVETAKRGFHTAVLDADITGSSIPKIFGIHEKAIGSEDGILLINTTLGIKIMSINLMLEEEIAPVIWRGPVIAGVVKQFWTDVVWGNIDVMFIDMPPGTGDVPLTVFQSFPVDGIIIVTSPQELVSMIVSKAVKMALMLSIPIFGLVENMSYVECPDCKKKIEIFGKSHIKEIAETYNLDILAQIPFDSNLTRYCDLGRLETIPQTFVTSAMGKLGLANSVWDE